MNNSISFPGQNKMGNPTLHPDHSQQHLDNYASQRDLRIPKCHASVTWDKFHRRNREPTLL